MALALNPKTLAIGSAVAAVAVVGAIASSGYIVSTSNYDQAMALAEQKVHNFVVEKVLDGNTDIPLSVKISQIRDRGFNRDMNLTINLDGDVLRIPFSAELGYFSYDFDFDLVKSTVGDEYLVKYFELDSLTDLNATAHADLLNGVLTFTGSSSFLNTLPEFHELEGSDLANLKEAWGYKDVGNAVLSFSIDSDETVKTALTVDSYLSDSIVLTGFSAAAQFKGLGEIKDFTSASMAADRILCHAGENRADVLEKALVTLDTTTMRRSGIFDAHYTLSSDVLDFDPVSLGNVKVSDIYVHGQLNGLSLQLLQEMGGAIVNYPDAYASFLAENGGGFTVDKGSSFIYHTQTKADKYAKPKPDQITFNLESSSNFALVDGDIQPTCKAKIEANRDLSLVYDNDVFMKMISMDFDNKKSGSSLTLDYSEDESGRFDLKVNGKSLRFMD